MGTNILRFPEKIDLEDQDIVDALLEVESFALKKALDLLAKHNPEKFEADAKGNLEYVARGANLLLSAAAEKVINSKVGLAAFVDKKV